MELEKRVNSVWESMLLVAPDEEDTNPFALVGLLTVFPSFRRDVFGKLSHITGHLLRSSENLSQRKSHL